MSVTRHATPSYSDADFEHGQVEANGISIHTVSMGQGPTVVFCHGFPESWYSWRHQLPAVAAAGFRAVALDMRGYGGTSAPAAVDAYSVSHLVGDVVGLVNALGADQAVVVGHDWGAPVAWYCALMRPDLFRAVAALSVPYIPPIALPEGLTMNALMQANAGDREYYRLYFQEPGVAEAALHADADHSVRGFLYTISGDIVADGVHPSGWDGHFPAGEGFVDQFVIPKTLPSWLTEADIEFYVSELSANGFRGGLNWYRNINALPAVLEPFAGATIKQPALYLGGEHDLIAGNTPEAIAALPDAVPGLRSVQILPGAGHWLQQERPQEVNAALLDFLAAL
jgi:pimeloyl-ACP methyl ester carboxylesterase